MRIKDSFIMQKIADEFIVVPIAEEAKRLHGVIQLNEAGAFLWERITEDAMTEDELAVLLADNYGLDSLSAKSDVSDFLTQLRHMDCVEL